MTISDLPTRFHFSLRGLMMVVFVVAVGLTTWRQPWAEWYEAVLAAALCGLLLGLAHQILDLCIALKRSPGLTTELRFAGWLAVAWRFFAMALIIAYCVFEASRREGWIVLARQSSGLFDERTALCDLTFYFAIVLVLASAPQLAHRPSNDSMGRRLIEAASWLLAAGVCLLVWSNWQSIVFLVHIAIAGIESRFPLKFANPDIDLDLVARSQRFAVHSLLAASLVGVNLWLVKRLAAAWPKGMRCRLLYAGSVSIGLGAAATCCVWLQSGELPQFSPYLAENPDSGLSSVFLYSAPLLLLASGAAGYRLIDSLSKSNPSLSLDWRREPRRYYHERGLTMGALLVAAVGALAKYCSAAGGNWRFALHLALGVPESYLQLAMIWVALCGLIRGWRNPSTSSPRLAALSPWQFTAVWAAMFATLITAIPLLAWLSFSFWILLGYRFEWL